MISKNFFPYFEDSHPLGAKDIIQALLEKTEKD